MRPPVAGGVCVGRGPWGAVNTFGRVRGARVGALCGTGVQDAGPATDGFHLAAWAEVENERLRGGGVAEGGAEGGYLASAWSSVIAMIAVMSALCGAEYQELWQAMIFHLAAWVEVENERLRGERCGRRRQRGGGCGTSGWRRMLTPGSRHGVGSEAPGREAGGEVEDRRLLKLKTSRLPIYSASSSRSSSARRSTAQRRRRSISAG